MRNLLGITQLSNLRNQLKLYKFLVHWYLNDFESLDLSDGHNAGRSIVKYKDQLLDLHELAVHKPRILLSGIIILTKFSGI